MITYTLEIYFRDQTKNTYYVNYYDIKNNCLYFNILENGKDTSTYIPLDLIRKFVVRS